VAAFVTAGAGFLLAVLWFDLMFDVQVLPHRGAPTVPADALDSIARYYGRVTTAARPMNRLIGAVMVATLAALLAQIASGDDPRWVGWASLALTVTAVGIAGAHTVPSAVRLGTRSDPVEEQSRLARSICRDHLTCFPLIASVLALQLGFAT
jgi:ER membrane protein SH3